MPKVIKPSNPFTNVCWVSVLTTFLRRHKFWLHRRFLLPNSETKKWWVMVSFGATAAGLFWTVNVCWAHPVISRASAITSSIFSWCYSGDALKFAENRMCRKLNKPKQWVVFLIVNDWPTMSGAMNRHCIPGLTMSTTLTGNFSFGLAEVTKTMHTGFSAYTYCIMPTPRCCCRKKPDVMI